MIHQDKCREACYEAAEHMRGAGLLAIDATHERVMIALRSIFYDTFMRLEWCTNGQERAREEIAELLAKVEEYEQAAKNELLL